MANDYVQELLRTLTIEKQPGSWQFVTQDLPPDLSEAIFALRERQGWTAIVPSRQPGSKWVRFELSVRTHLHPFGLGAAIEEVLGKAEIPCFFVDGSFAPNIFVDERQADRAETLLAALAQEQ